MKQWRSYRMVTYNFDGTTSTFKNDIGEAVVSYKKMEESRVEIVVNLKHFNTNTKASYKKSIEFKNGAIHHYPIRQFTVKDQEVKEFNTVKKYFTNLLGEQGYKELKNNFLNEYTSRQALELSILLGQK